MKTEGTEHCCGACANGDVCESDIKPLAEAAGQVEENIVSPQELPKNNSVVYLQQSER